MTWSYFKNAPSLFWKKNEFLIFEVAVIFYFQKFRVEKKLFQPWNMARLTHLKIWTCWSFCTHTALWWTLDCKVSLIHSNAFLGTSKIELLICGKKIAIFYSDFLFSKNYFQNFKSMTKKTWLCSFLRKLYHWFVSLRIKSKITSCH